MWRTRSSHFGARCGLRLCTRHPKPSAGSRAAACLMAYVSVSFHFTAICRLLAQQCLPMTLHTSPASSNSSRQQLFTNQCCNGSI